MNFKKERDRLRDLYEAEVHKQFNILLAQVKPYMEASPKFAAALKAASGASRENGIEAMELFLSKQVAANARKKSKAAPVVVEPAVAPANTKTRRSKWQALAHRKYPKMYRIGGDGGDDCWLALSTCPHQQIKHWFYVLTDSQDKAEKFVQKWDEQTCNPQCKGVGNHKLWHLRLDK